MKALRALYILSIFIVIAEAVDSDLAPDKPKHTPKQIEEQPAEDLSQSLRATAEKVKVSVGGWYVLIFFTLVYSI